MDSHNHKTIIETNIPRVDYKEHGVLYLKIPWDEEKSRFTMEP